MYAPLIRCAFWGLTLPSRVCPHDLWFLLATAVPGSKQPLKGLDEGPCMRNSSALAKGDGQASFC